MCLHNNALSLLLGYPLFGMLGFVVSAVLSLG